MGVSVLSKPTKEDADLLLRYFAIMRSDEDFKKAVHWFWEEFNEKTYRAFKRKYPARSEGYRNFTIVCSYWEILSTLVNNDVLNEDLVFDMFILPWERAEPIVYGLRKDWKEPRLYENFEVLAKRKAEWEKTHPPKV